MAGVSSFGFSGTNAHVILEEAPQTAALTSEVERPLHILALSAKTPNALGDIVQRYQQFLRKHPQQRLEDITYTATTGRSHFAVRACFIASSPQQLLQLLEQQAVDHPSALPYYGESTLSQPAQVALLFTGQGSQYPNMARSLFQTQPAFRDNLIQCDQMLRPYMDRSLLSLLFPQDNEQHDDLNQTVYAQPALFAVEYALAQLWLSWGVKPKVLLGHSIGEYVAACIAGVFSLEEGLRLIAARARLMQALPQNGAMAAIAADANRVQQTIAAYGQISIAAINAPQQTVISGDRAAVEAVCKEFSAQKIPHTRLNVSHAFHSPLMQPMLADFKQVAEHIRFQPPTITLISNLTGQVISDDLTRPQYWLDHVLASVRFEQSVRTAYDLGCRVFLELGPTPVLSGLGQQCIDDVQCRWLSTLHRGRDEWEGTLRCLASLYQLGVSINWQAFDSPYTRRKIALPTYPFQRKKFWFQTKKAPAPTFISENSLNPLLGHKIPLSRSETRYYESYYSPTFPKLLSDHKLFDSVVVPGAAYITTVIAAAQDALDATSVEMSDLYFLQPLVISPDENYRVQTSLSFNEDNSAKFEVNSLLEDKQNSGRQNWLSHVSGHIQAQHVSATAILPKITSLSADNVNHKSIDGTDFYRKFERYGYHLGPRFQGLKSIWQHENEIICELSLQNCDDYDQYDLYPGIVDSVFQALSVAHSNKSTLSENEIYLPFYIRKLSYTKPASLTESLWCKVTYSNVDNQSENSVTGDMLLFDKHGTVILCIEGFEGRIARDIKPSQYESDIFYQLDWLEQERNTTGISSNAGTGENHWLIFADKNGVGRSLVDELRIQTDDYTLVTPGDSSQTDSSCRCTLDPQRAGDFHQLLTSVSTKNTSINIVFLWALDRFQHTPNEIYASALYLTQAAAQCTSSIRLSFVTRAAQAAYVNSLGHIDAIQAAIWGFVRTVMWEHPNLSCQLIDLDVTASAKEKEDLLAELRDRSGENQIAFRQNRRLAARLTTRPMTPTDSQNFFIKPDSTYLITGGQGALGLKLANWLVDKGADTIVLTGRSEANSPTQLFIETQQKRGISIRYIPADVGDLSQTKLLFTTVDESGPPLRGVFHTAGVLDDGSVGEQDWQRFSNVLAPKITGTWNLHNVTKDSDLDYFVCFSSIAAVIGSPGQSSYAMANAYMDALMAYRRGKNLVGISINWGPWGEFGMAASLGRMHQQRMTAGGINALNPETGFIALEHSLQDVSLAQIVIASIDWKHWFSARASSSPPLLNRLAVKYQNMVTPLKPQLIEKLKQANGQDKNKVLTLYLKELLSSALGYESSNEIDESMPLTNYGVDSITIIELRNQLRSLLGVDIPISEFFSSITISELSTKALQHFQGESKNAETTVYQEIQTVPKQDYYPVSHAQFRLWLLHQVDHNNSAYHLPAIIPLPESADKNAIEDVIYTMTLRHETLRTSFEEHEDRPVQVIRDPTNISIDTVSLTSLEAMHDYFRNFSVAKFDLTSVPLFRANYAVLDNGQKFLLWCMHEIIADGTASAIFQHEAEKLLSAYQSDLENPLTPLTIQYKDFATWHNQLIAGEEGRKSRDYWHGVLETPPNMLELPFDFPISNAAHRRRSIYSFDISASQFTSLQRFIQQQNVSLFMLIQAILCLMLSRVTGQRDLIFGSAASGRIHQDVQPLIGCFVNTILLRHRIPQHATFVDLLSSIRETTIESLTHQLYPFDRLVDELNIKREADRFPLTSVLLNVMNFSDSIIPYSIDRDMKIELELYAVPKHDSVYFECHYRNALFTQQTIATLLGTFTDLITQVVQNPSLNIDKYKLFMRDNTIMDANRLILTSDEENLENNTHTDEAEVVI
ncbi:MAG: SDR family NAD(P)-dependent oxidoreductase [Gammaproteobacteria bacterium]|nr:SDR family NAD(P)-dependent oxidoreductase [Gammaproteobacteria bacterium]